MFGHEFVKRIVNAILLPDSKAGERYSPRIMHYLLEEGYVNATMSDGHLINRLRDQGDWVSVLPVLPTIHSHAWKGKYHARIALDCWHLGGRNDVVG